MLKLIRPCSLYLESYQTAFEEYETHGVNTYSFSNTKDCNIFEKFENYRLERNLKPNRVGADYYWLVDDEKECFIGEICIRHQLTDQLERYGGHIGYGVRRSKWKKGYGTLMLKLALEKAKDMGITEILITCDDDNPASAKVMENNGMILQDKVQNIIDGKKVITRRYWKNLSI